jgi:hypothetical protein
LLCLFTASIYLVLSRWEASQICAVGPFDIPQNPVPFDRIYDPCFQSCYSGNNYLFIQDMEGPFLSEWQSLLRKTSIRTTFGKAFHTAPPAIKTLSLWTSQVRTLHTQNRLSPFLRGYFLYMGRSELKSVGYHQWLQVRG